MMKARSLLIALALGMGMFMYACNNDDETTPANIKPVAAFDVSASSVNINEALTFTDQSTDEDGEVVSRLWNFGDNATSTEANPTHTYTVKGTYTVSLTVTDDNGGTAETTKTIVVADPADANVDPVADFTTGETVYLSGADIAFTDASTDADGAILEWAWDFGDGNTSTDQNPTHSYTEVKSYEVSLTVTDNLGAETTVTKTINIGGVLWSYATGRNIESTTPAIADDGMVFATSSGKEGNTNIHAINPDGTEKWAIEVGDIVRSSPVIGADGTVYTSSYDDFFYALDPADGTIVWSYELGSNAKYSTAALGTDGSIYIGSQTDNFHALNADGTLKWEFPTGGDVNGSAVIGADGTIYINSTDDFLYALNPADGSMKWNYEYGSWSGTALAMGSDGTIYIAGESSAETGVVAAVNPNGSEKWSITTSAVTGSPTNTGKIDQGGPAIGPDGTVYVGTKGPELLALDPNTGAVKWSYTNPAFAGIGSTPAIDQEGNVYFGDDSGIFTVLDKDGNVKFELSLGAKIWSSVTFDDNGVIYICATQADDTGLIYAIELYAGGPANSAWPMRHGNRKHTGNIND